MALELNKKEAYLNYQILSNHVHSSIYSNLSRVKEINNVNYFTSKKTNDLDSYAITTESLEWIICASVAIGNILDIEQLKKFSDLGVSGEDILVNIQKLN